MAVDAEVLKALKATPLLESFTDTGLQILASIALVKDIPAGTPLFVENMLGEAMYILVDGRLRLSIRDKNNQEQMLSHVHPNDSVGEVALLRVGPRMCSATAELASRVIELNRRDFMQLQKARPQACLKLMMNIVERVGAQLDATRTELRDFVHWRLSFTDN